MDQYTYSSERRTARSRSLTRTRGSASLPDLQQNFAHVLARFHHPVSVGRLTQREYAIDYDFDLASLQQRPDVLPQALSDRGFLLNCLRTQVRPGNCQPARHDRV
jgi:hypothetical protein